MINVTDQMYCFPPLVLFTDLDGTLLDHYSYSFLPALTALEELAKLGIPWIPNTSKTFTELNALRDAMNHQGPFVVENGAAIYLPLSSPWAQAFTADIASNTSQGSPFIRDGDFLIYRFGLERDQLLKTLSPFRDIYRFRSFSQMDVEELMDLTGLSRVSASLALERQFSEPIHWQDSEEALHKLRTEIEASGLTLVRGGRFVHLMGLHSKADAINWMKAIALEQGVEVKTIALGDGENDVEMLQAADFPVVVRSPVHAPINIPNREKVLVTEGLGPVGWNQAVLSILTKFSNKPTL